MHFTFSCLVKFHQQFYLQSIGVEEFQLLQNVITTLFLMRHSQIPQIIRLCKLYKIFPFMYSQAMLQS